MNHFDEDELLKFALDILEAAEAKEIIEHLASCEMCGSKFDEISKDLDVIGSFEPQAENFLPPKTEKSPNLIAWFARAAVLISVFTAGYFTSALFQKDQISVIGQQFKPKSPPLSVTEPIPCPNIDIM